MLNTLLSHLNHDHPVQNGQAFAHTNIALIKYWGKRDTALNLPLTDSLSVGLPGYGTQAHVAIADGAHTISINKSPLSPDHPAWKNLHTLLDNIRNITRYNYILQLDFNIPVAAGFASSASCYASIALALNDLHKWQLSTAALSIMARLGSGSAARSIEPGFCLWQAGTQSDGMDSFATQLPTQWPELCIGLLHIDGSVKKQSSRLGMQHTQDTSVLFKSWPEQVARDLALMQEAITHKDFIALGETAENNAEAMHACMHSAKPALIYSQPDTLLHKQRIRALRHDGLPIYYTQDAGPNLKCVFLSEYKDAVLSHFSNMTIIHPFGSDS